MTKEKLVRFINKYYLNGTVKSVKLNSNSNKLSARFISGNKSMLGELEMDKWQFEDCEIGIYDTEQLLKLLSVLDDDINIIVNKSGDKSFSLKISDSISSVNYMLTDVSIIGTTPSMNTIPNFELKIDVTSKFINKFIVGKGALTETNNFTVITDGNETKIVIGYASINTNRVTIPVTTSESSNIDNVSFNADFFKEILVANKECESATLEVSSDGLSRITFNIDDFSVTYFLLALADVD
tara:strand:- start:377 stop:1096 length:720 start_codon:yes stop_codon:yes gene_type:complete